MGLPFEKLPQHVQDRIRRDNPSVFIRAVPPKVAKPIPDKTLARDVSGQEKGDSGVAISIRLIVLTKRLMDSDNAIACTKPLRDCIAKSLGVDDGDKRLTWEYHQLKTSGQEGVIVTLSTPRLTPNILVDT